MNDLKRRQNLESELAKITDAIVEAEASTMSEHQVKVLEVLASKRKHEIEQELIMLPESVDEESLEAINGQY